MFSSLPVVDAARWWGCGGPGLQHHSASALAGHWAGNVSMLGAAQLVSEETLLTCDYLPGSQGERRAPKNSVMPLLAYLKVASKPGVVVLTVMVMTLAL